MQKGTSEQEGDGIMKRTVLAVVVLALLTQGALASIYSEDFSTDPFASRWTKTSTAGYGLYWTGSIDGPSINPSLPADAGNPLEALYTFSNGTKYAWTTDVTEQTTSYTAKMDFMVNGDSAVSDNSFGQLLQRQADNTCYEARFALGGNGQARFIGAYGTPGYGGVGLVANVWYQLVTDVAISASDVQMQSQIVRISDSAVMHTSPLFTDASAGRLVSSKGYGIQLGLPGTHYWNQALQVDNFEVVPEPATFVLLAAGSLLLRKRRA
jgi:hypothetical protein